MFVFSPAGENSKNRFFYHIGSSFLIALLRARGFSAEQFINSQPATVKIVAGEIVKKNPRIVGFSVYNSNFITSVLIAVEIRRISPSTIITFGGPSATSHSEFILENYSPVDICFRNESEETFLQLVSLLSENHFDLNRISLAGISGISYRTESNIVVNPDCNILLSNSGCTDFLDKYPSPYLSGVIPGPDAYEVGLLTARGCNQNCVYCNCAVLSNRRFTTHSIGRVISELDYISRFDPGKGMLSFFDDAFSLIPQRAKNICRAIIENRIRIPLSCITRSDHVDEELLDLMHEAGFVSVGFSLESANPRTLRVIGKVSKPEDDPTDKLEKEIRFIEKLDEVSAYARKIGIRNIFASIMVGLPYESYEEAKNTIDTIDRYTNIDFYSHNQLDIFKGTPLYNDHRKYGYRIEFKDGNPIFSKTICPDDIPGKVKASVKSTLYLRMKEDDKDTLRILSLQPGNYAVNECFNSVIIISDKVEKDLVIWLQDVLSVGGTIIQIYSSRESSEKLANANFDNYSGYFSPSYNIRNYYFKKVDDHIEIVSSHAGSFNSKGDHEILKICDFGFFRTNLSDPEFSFLKVMCRESDHEDSNSAYAYFSDRKQDGKLFEYLINKKPMPSFVNLCRWSSNISNCRKMETLIINDRSELKFCWYGNIVGTVGQSWKEIADNFISDRKRILDKRKCESCPANEKCCKCPSPFPLPEEDYCRKQRSADLEQVADLFMSLDVVKQYV